jgi:penicillin-binding protein 2
MAMVTATIANRGISYRPRLVHRVLDQNGRDVADENGKIVAPHEPSVRADLHTVGITEEGIELVRRGMWKVVNEPGGTGKRAKIPGVEVAGKTGTAQFWREMREGKTVTKIKDNHTWFICFAPYAAPKYAICVFVQGAKSGGGVSAPVAEKILEESLALEKGLYDPGLKWLEPAVGSFAQIEQVDYKKSELTPDVAADLETAEHTDTPSERKAQRQISAKPDIRAAPDQGGQLPPRAIPANPRVDKRGFFQRFFGVKRPAYNPRPAPPPRPGGR